MVRKFIKTVVLGLIIIGGIWAVVNRDRMKSPTDAWNLIVSSLPTLPSWDQGAAPSELSGWHQAPRPNTVIRVASFNIQALGPQKGSDPQIMQRLAEICTQFDLIAIQEVRDASGQIVQQLVEEMNRMSLGTANFDGVIGPASGSNAHYQERAAFVFDTHKVVLDGARPYTINDPDDVLIRDPLVGWFRTTVPQHDLAFTFTLVNLHVDAQQPLQELEYLQEIFRAVRSDGRAEDDVILAGDFNAGDRGLEQLQQYGLTWAITNQPTNVRQTRQYDNLIFDSRATREYTGQSGTLNFLKLFNLSIADATAISDHMPVWSDFGIYEGMAPPSRTAERERQVPGFN